VTTTQNGLSVTFFAAGQPAQQGSKAPVGNGRFIESNSQLKSWRSVVAAACPMEAPLACGVSLTVEFRYSRPKSHYGRRNGQPYLKGNAPIYKTSAPDLDKLIRAVNDALKGIAFVDDALVVYITASKVYTHRTVGAYITITPLSEP
jgi:crossover junction endodeoxyribonuclease RusA